MNKVLGLQFQFIKFSFKFLLGFICPFSMATSKDQRSEREREGVISFKFDEALLATGALRM